MKKLQVLLTAEINTEVTKELEKYVDIEYCGWVVDQVILTEEKMIELAKGKDIIITSYDPITMAVIDSAPDLKLIVCTRANPVNVDALYAAKKGIKISYAPGRNSDCAAEFTVALMLSVTRMIPMAFKDLYNGKYLGESTSSKDTKEGLRRDVTWSLGKNTPYVEYKGFQMRGHTLGVIGYGSIGRKVSAIIHGFGMNIIAYDPFLTQDQVEEYITLKSFDEVISEADIITLHCKDTPDTEGIINAKVFEKMKDTAYFVNTSRGALVNEAELVEALLSHKIAGAALDVFAIEPIPKDHPFLTQCNNIVITPHLAGATYDAITNHTIQLVTDVKHFLNGEALEFEYHLK